MNKLGKFAIFIVVSNISKLRVIMNLQMIFDWILFRRFDRSRTSDFLKLSKVGWLATMDSGSRDQARSQDFLWKGGGVRMSTIGTK